MSNAVTIILAEYEALRAELMFFLSLQRRNMTMLVTASLGQAGFLFLNLKKLETEALVFAYLYLFPFLVFVIMLRALENTSKILLVADYIHKGIKEQLKSATSEYSKFFEWEEHKARTNRISKTTLYLLDISKWSVFLMGLILSLISAFWLASSLDENPLSKLHYISAGILDTLWVGVCIRFSCAFNEVQGETRFYQDDETKTREQPDQLDKK